MWTPLKTFKPSLLYLIPLKILINLTWNWDSKPGIYRYRHRIGIGRYEKKPYRLFIGSADIENGIYRCLSVSRSDGSWLGRKCSTKIQISRLSAEISTGRSKQHNVWFLQLGLTFFPNFLKGFWRLENVKYLF